MDTIYQNVIVTATVVTCSLLIATACLAWLPREVKSETPIAMSYFAGVWGLIVIGCIFGFSMRLGQTTWFVAGWERSAINIMGIEISTFWGYMIVTVYQISRCVIGSILANVFRPFLIGKIQNKSIVPHHDVQVQILFAQAACTVFVFVSSITDIFLFLSRCDMAMITLATTIVSDWFCTHLIMNTTTPKYSSHLVQLWMVNEKQDAQLELCIDEGGNLTFRNLCTRKPGFKFSQDGHLVELWLVKEKRMGQFEIFTDPTGDIHFKTYDGNRPCVKL